MCNAGANGGWETGGGTVCTAAGAPQQDAPHSFPVAGSTNPSLPAILIAVERPVQRIRSSETQKTQVESSTVSGSILKVRQQLFVPAGLSGTLPCPSPCNTLGRKQTSSYRWLQSMGQKGVESALKEEAAHALSLLHKAMGPDPSSPDKPKEKEKEGSGHHKRFHLLRRAPMSLRITQQDLAGCKVWRPAEGACRTPSTPVILDVAGMPRPCCWSRAAPRSCHCTFGGDLAASMRRQGLVFGRAYRQGKVVKSSASGVGFAIARHINEDGELWWSAPAFLNVVGSGFGLSVGEPGTEWPSLCTISGCGAAAAAAAVAAATLSAGGTATSDAVRISLAGCAPVPVFCNLH